MTTFDWDQLARDRYAGGTPEEHLWCLALLIGTPEHYVAWQTADGTPIDAARHVSEAAEGVRALRRRIAELERTEKPSESRRVCDVCLRQKLSIDDFIRFEGWTVGDIQREIGSICIGRGYGPCVATAWKRVRDLEATIRASIDDRNRSAKDGES